MEEEVNEENKPMSGYGMRLPDDCTPEELQRLSEGWTIPMQGVPPIPPGTHFQVVQRPAEGDWRDRLPRTDEEVDCG